MASNQSTWAEAWSTKTTVYEDRLYGSTQNLQDTFKLLLWGGVGKFGASVLTGSNTKHTTFTLNPGVTEVKMSVLH